MSLQGLKVTMKKHPSAFKLCGYLVEKLQNIGSDPFTLYEGTITLFFLHQSRVCCVFMSVTLKDV